MHVLVTWGTKEGGTEGIARVLGDALRRDGVDVMLEPADKVKSLRGFDAVIVGGPLYAFRWHRDARRFVERNVELLRRVPVWFFSSGPLDDSAEKRELPPVAEVEALMQRVGAVGHITFGGRLKSDARGPAAQAMAKKSAGDWRNPERIQAWAHQLTGELKTARPRPFTEPAGRSMGRWVGYGLAGAAISALALAVLLQAIPGGLAVALHALAVALIFASVSVPYFRAPGARQPLSTGLLFALLTGIFHMAVSVWAVGLSAALSVGVWLPALIALIVTAGTGATVIMMQGARSSGMLQDRGTAAA